MRCGLRGIHGQKLAARDRRFDQGGMEQSCRRDLAFEAGLSNDFLEGFIAWA